MKINPLIRRLLPACARPALRRRALHEQRGFALVSAIFLITILFLLSAYLVALRVHQSSGVVLDMLATRAYAAASSGAEWAAYNSLRNNACPASSAIVLGGTLAEFTASVTCVRGTYEEGGTAVNIDTIVSNACNQPAAGVCPNSSPGANYVERQITLMVGQ